MKKILKRIATMATVLALIVITGISMAACGNGSNGGDSIKDNNIDELKGYYANFDAQKLYYFDIDTNSYAYGKFSIGDAPKENGKYALTISRDDERRYASDYSNKLQVYHGTDAFSVYKVWSVEPSRESCLIISRDNDNSDLSKKFYARDDQLVYSKISNLDEFFANVFPNVDIDLDDVTITYSQETVWEDLLLEA